MKKLPEELETYIRRMGSHKGYKGKGMCTPCRYRLDSINGDKQARCVYYSSSCQLVSRNCLGSK